MRAGFRTVELMATLPGELFYRALGFEQLERTVAALPDGVELPLVRMAQVLAAAPDATASRDLPNS
jgi:hypothetical protein